MESAFDPSVDMLRELLKCCPSVSSSQFYYRTRSVNVEQFTSTGPKAACRLLDKDA
jgi:hypothetical protein